MHFVNFWSSFIWGLVFAGDFGVLYVLLRSHLWRRWLALFVLCAWGVVITAVLAIVYLVTPGHYASVYWAERIPSSVIGIWLISELASGFFSIEQMRRTTRVVFWNLAGFFTVCASLFASDEPIGGIPHIGVIVSRGTSLGCIVVFLIFLYGARVLRLAWPAGAKGIAAGYALAVMGEVAVSWLLGLVNPQMLSIARAVMYLTCFVTWFATLRCQAEAPIPRDSTDSSITS